MWEIAIKHKKKPETMPYCAADIRNYAMRAGYIFLSLNLDSISTYEKYDLNCHKDPFDQMLVCQSQTHNMRLLTHDEKLREFGVGFVEYFCDISLENKSFNFIFKYFKFSSLFILLMYFL